MAYSAITNAEIDQDSPITQTLMTKYRDNILATKGMVFLASSDASSDATIDFTEFDASLYDGYFFVLSNVTPASNANLLVRTSSDGGSSYDSGSSDYGYAIVEADTSDTVGAIGTVSASSIVLHGGTGVGAGAGEEGFSGTLTIHGPHLAKETKVTWAGGYMDSAITSAFNHVNGSARRKSSADVDAIRFLFSTGNIESGTITMYGLWNAA